MTLISTGSPLRDNLIAERKRIHAEWRKPRTSVRLFFAPKSVQERIDELEVIRGTVKKCVLDEMRRNIRDSARDFGEADPLDAPAEGTAELPGITIIPKIQHVVAKYFDISWDDLISHRRNIHIIRPRQIAMYLSKKLTPRSYCDIARRFCGRDHTTIIHACHKIERLITTDAAVAHDVAALREMLG